MTSQTMTYKTIKPVSQTMITLLSDPFAMMIASYLSGSSEGLTIEQITRRHEGINLDTYFVARTLNALICNGYAEVYPIGRYKLNRAKCAEFIADLSKFLCGGPLP
jgi:hypothetical protein